MRVLLVDEMAAATAQLLTTLRQYGYAVDHAGNNVDAAYKVEINAYGLVLLNMELCQAGSPCLCQTLRSRGFQGLVTVMTTRNTVQDRIRAFDSGADDCLQMPFDSRELLARIRALSRRSPMRVHDRLRVRDLEINTAQRTVRRGDQKISLTAKEYVILEYMARHKDELITRTELSEHAWDENYDPFSNLIEVYILRLRRKIDAPFQEKLLCTVRGEGYRLATEVSV